MWAAAAAAMISGCVGTPDVSSEAEEAALNELPTCAGRKSCSYALGAPCQCDLACGGYKDCCADVKPACADARADEGVLVTALSKSDLATIDATAARGRFDTSRVWDTALGHYTSNGQPKLAHLLGAGARVNVVTRTGITPIMYPSLDGPAVEAMLAAGADVELRSVDGRTPLMVRSGLGVAQFGDVKALLAHGAKVNAVSPHGNTALMFALSAFYTGPVSLLLAAGADPNARNADGMIPLTIAVRHSLPNELRAMIAKGADLDNTGPSGEPVWVYTLVDNDRGLYSDTATPDDDLLMEWLFTHPALKVEWSQTLATTAINNGLKHKSVMRYAQYLAARASHDPHLGDGDLVASYQGYALRLAAGKLRKNGLDVTPPSLDLSESRVFQLGASYYFLTDSAALPAGWGSTHDTAVPAAKRGIVRYYPEGAHFSQCPYNYVNVHGMENIAIAPNGTLTGTVPGKGTIYVNVTCY